MGIFNFLARPLGAILHFIYQTIAFQNYGLAIILFTIIIKAVLMPLTFKQLKSSAQMQELQPKIKELQVKYKNDKQMLNEELIKFYKENNYNPASGCLPVLVQLPILISLYQVIMKPLRYLFGMSDDNIKALAKIVNGFITKSADKLDIKAMDLNIQIINYFHNNWDKLADSNVAKYISKAEIINMDFLGINLSLRPKYDLDLLFGSNALHYWVLLIIPILAVVLQFVSTKYSMKKTMATTDKNDQSAQMTKMMVYFAPMMTLFFVFSFPVGLALYWTVGSAFQVLQQYIINKYKSKSAKKEVLISK